MRQSPISSRNRSTTTVRSDGTDAGGALLLLQERQQVARGERVEPDLVDEALRRLLLRQRRQLTREAADRLAELVRAADPLALPERHRARNSRRGRHEHAVARDLLDPPRRRAEHDHLPRARLVHHLLVELADAAAAVDDEDAEETAVRDRAGVGDGEAARALPPAHDSAGAVPDDARPQLCELVGRIPAGEHVEHVLELRAREVGERIRAAHELVQRVDLDLRVGADADDLLREHVERVARDLRLLDRALAHPLRDHRRLEQVGAELREDASLRHLAERVAGAADPLQPARDRLRRLDLDDEIDGAHVDAELERRRGDEARDSARLQVLLDLHPLLARERAVMRAGDLFLGELVEPQCEPLGKAAVVDEDDRRAVRADELDDRGIDRRPDRVRAALRTDVRLLAVGRRRMRQRARRRQLAHVLERDDDLQVELLRNTGVDELDRTSTRNEAADLLERALRRREADALERPVAEQLLQPLDREREVRAALRPGDGVHLVEDERVDGAEQLTRLRRQQEEERLRSRDQDVGRVAQHRRALLLRRVAGADGDAELRLEPGERTAQVPLDVVVQRLQRRDVEHAQSGAGRRRQPVDRVEEGGERLAGAGRRLDQRVRAGGDHGPALLLRGRRRGEVRSNQARVTGRRRPAAPRKEGIARREG